MSDEATMTETIKIKRPRLDEVEALIAASEYLHGRFTGGGAAPSLIRRIEVEIYALRFLLEHLK